MFVNRQVRLGGYGLGNTFGQPHIEPDGWKTLDHLARYDWIAFHATALADGKYNIPIKSALLSRNPRMQVGGYAPCILRQAQWDSPFLEKQRQLVKKYPLKEDPNIIDLKRVDMEELISLTSYLFLSDKNSVDFMFFDNMPYLGYITTSEKWKWKWYEYVTRVIEIWGAKPIYFNTGGHPQLRDLSYFTERAPVQTDPFNIDEGTFVSMMTNQIDGLLYNHKPDSVIFVPWTRSPYEQLMSFACACIVGAVFVCEPSDFNDATKFWETNRVNPVYRLTEDIWSLEIVQVATSVWMRQSDRHRVYINLGNVSQMTVNSGYRIMDDGRNAEGAWVHPNNYLFLEKV